MEPRRTVIHLCGCCTCRASLCEDALSCIVDGFVGQIAALLTRRHQMQHFHTVEALQPLICKRPTRAHVQRRHKITKNAFIEQPLTSSRCCCSSHCVLCPDSQRSPFSFPFPSLCLPASVSCCKVLPLTVEGLSHYKAPSGHCSFQLALHE